MSDYAVVLKHKRRSSRPGNHGSPERGSTDRFSLLDLVPDLGNIDLGTFDLGAIDLGEGCGEALVVVLAAAVFLALAWFMMEFGIPLVAGLTHLLVRGMLARAVNRWHLCRGNLLRSCGEGLAWATVYTAPLLAVAFLVHEVFAWQ